MKKFLLAALFALSVSFLSGSKASAQCCFGLKGAFNVKVCASGFLVPYVTKSCDPCGACGPCGGGGCGPAYCWPYGGGGAGGCYGGGCPGPLPGPWYAFWPYDGQSQIAANYGGPWTLDRHFTQPAPTGYPYYPHPMVMHASPYAHGMGGIQPTGYCPSGWFGR